MSLKDFLTQTVQLGIMTPRTGEGAKTWPLTSYAARLDQPGSNARLTDPLFGSPEANLFLDGSSVIDVRADDIVMHGTKQYVILRVRDMRDQTALRHYEIAITSQEFKTGSVLRYIEIGGKPQAGILPIKQLVPDLANQSCYAQGVSTKEVLASHGLFELTDVRFVFYTKLYETDEISFDGKTYRIIQLQYYDSNIGKCVVVARAV